MTGLVLGQVACNDVKFENLNASSQKLQDPDSPTELPVLPTAKGPDHKTGVCSQEQKISGCLQCTGLTLPPPPPPSLTKAEKLADIMSRGCLIANDSDPKDVKIPSKQDMLARLQSCTSEIYPETSLLSIEQQTIDDLLDPANISFQNKIFKGLYYQPPFTDHFETYFGLETKEARQILCFNQGPLTGDLETTEYSKECLQSEDNCRSLSREPLEI